MREYNPRKIYELASTNPVVNRVIKRWENGDLSWDQAMI
jgi:hypothetical protein